MKSGGPFWRGPAHELHEVGISQEESSVSISELFGRRSITAAASRDRDLRGAKKKRSLFAISGCSPESG